jgi:hypothetical protein
LEVLGPVSNDGYNCSPINPYFLGWNNEFDVINAILAAAYGRVNVYEMETQQELNLASFTVLARYMYDNSSPQSAGLSLGQVVDVVSNLRSLMTNNGFDPGRVTWSSAACERSQGIATPESGRTMDAAETPCGRYLRQRSLSGGPEYRR